ncbi:MAG TPA: methyltransferase domain-containing protein [Bryobacteraceae bacterium]|nr:methyltransferase domain-containing protein [Bryobacteraceae bacterium]
MLSSGPLLRGRRIEPEILDDTPPDQSRGSLGDLVRINRVFGGHAVLKRTLSTVLRAGEMFTMLDVGAASGDVGARVRRWYPRATVTSLDYRVHHLAGALPPRVCADAFVLPFRQRSFDIVHCSLFLHHFEDERIIGLLRSFGRVARRFVAVTDLERHPLAYYAVPLTRWLFRWDPITLHDAPISVAAGFHVPELRRLAEAAGARVISIRTYRPAFRVALLYSET